MNNDRHFLKKLVDLWIIFWQSTVYIFRFFNNRSSFGLSQLLDCVAIPRGYVTCMYNTHCMEELLSLKKLVVTCWRMKIRRKFLAGFRSEIGNWANKRNAVELQLFWELTCVSQAILRVFIQEILALDMPRTNVNNCKFTFQLCREPCILTLIIKFLGDCKLPNSTAQSIRICVGWKSCFDTAESSSIMYASMAISPAYISFLIF